MFIVAHSLKGFSSELLRPVAFRPIVRPNNIVGVCSEGNCPPHSNQEVERQEEPGLGLNIDSKDTPPET